MTHNIIGSEADRTGPIVLVREIPKRSRTSPVVWWLAGAALVGTASGLVDVFVLDRPLTIIPILISLFAWRFWPSRGRRS